MFFSLAITLMCSYSIISFSQHNHRYKSIETFFKNLNCNLNTTHEQHMLDISRKKPNFLPKIYSLLKNLNCGISNMEVPFFLKASNYTKKGRVMIDIGLDKAEETRAAVKNGFRVYAFEPNSRSIVNIVKLFKQENISYDLIEDVDAWIKSPKRSKLNKWSHVYLFHAAAGNERTSVPMFIAGEGSSIVDHIFGNKQPSEIVQVVRVDDIVIEPHIYYFKVDVQGFEYSVFQGAKNMFLNHKVEMVTSEFYLKGLKAAKVEPEQLITLLTVDFQLTCFDSRHESGIVANHPEDMNEYLKVVNETNKYSEKVNKFWGFFDDFTCLSFKATAKKIDHN